MYEFPERNQETGDIWHTNADYWDERMAEGNVFHKQLIEPTQLRLLDLKPDDLVVELACGNGQFTRKMAELGARVVASDYAEGMLANARRRTTENTDRIEYLHLDVTDESQLLALGERRFDAGVCTMAIMDIASIEPLIAGMSRILKPDAPFVFSIMHPCFNSPNGMARARELEEKDGHIEEKYYVKIPGYITPIAYKGVAMIGQPELQNYFHRPISVLYNAFFKGGFVLDGVEEPIFDLPYREDRPLTMENFREIPWALVSRMRLV